MNPIIESIVNIRFNPIIGKINKNIEDTTPLVP